MLEYLAHVERASAPGDLVFVEAVIPDADVVALDSARLPRNWRSEPPSPELRAVGDDWVASKRGLALRVPSVIVPQEFNLLINPAHGRFRSIRVLSPQAVTIDPRLL
jgi:RES domain-containing protein